MKRLTFRGLAEVIGVFAVMGSLVFVGLEVRQNSIATRASTNASVSDSYRELNLLIASSPELVRALIAVGPDPSAASAEDKIMVLSLFRALFHTWSNAHRQWSNETLDVVLYNSVIAEISTYSLNSNGERSIDQINRRGKTFRWAWNSEKFIFNSEFQDFVDEILESKKTHTG